MTPKLSPEKYIISNARKLPIHAVYLAEEWNETGLASILVARKHPQGNITCAAYMVDLKCVGLKETYYFFNKTPEQFQEFIEDYSIKLNLIKSDYNFVHNLIYGAIAFAEEFKISPQKDFAITQYILEEDTDDIPLIDFEFGENGIPHLIVTPAMPSFIKYLANLKKFAGEGNYFYTIQDDWGDAKESNYESFLDDDNEEDDDYEEEIK
ncbi:MAG: hypothetical protein EAZ53_16125 [Bacteroidetes bacterium]|nr:MAG: hypothetical protein EAZ53_16125 [Bacteroidota bacterium]